MPTRYKIVDGFPGYRVGTDGSIWTRIKCNGQLPATLGETWRPLKQAKLSNGYYFVAISNNGFRVQRKVHHLVLEAFIGSRPEGTEACHKNGNKADNRLSNLRWGTHSSNYADRVLHGTGNEGENNYSVKITESCVRAIMSDLTSGISQTKIGNKYGISQMLVSQIKCGRAWTHVTGLPRIKRARRAG